MSEADKIIKNLKNSGKKVEEFYVSNKTSDKNVSSIEDDVKILEEFAEICKAGLACYDQTREGEALEHLLAEREQMLKERDVANDSVIAHKFAVMQQQINEKDKRIQELEEESRKKSIELICYQEELENSIANLAEREQKDKRIQKLEEENMKLKAQHIFTKRNSTVEEKAKIFDVIDRTVDTFLEKEKLLWEQKFKANKMSVEEATDIVNEMYQERMKSISEDENTVNVDKLDDVKFTNLEFASVRLLREVQSLQRKLVNSIPKQKVKEVLQKKRNELFGITYLSKEQYRPYEMQVERINKIEQELLEGAEK